MSENKEFFYLLLVGDNAPSGYEERAKKALDETQIPYRVARVDEVYPDGIELFSGLTDISGLGRILAIAARNKKRKQLSENTK